jgi:hypothetical protein
MPGVGRLVAKHEEQRFTGRLACEKEVASSAACVVRFPSCRRMPRAAAVARSALSHA